MITDAVVKAWMVENDGTILYDKYHPGVFNGYVTFTPERAAMALENNTHNRKIGSQVHPLRAAMENGLWDDNVSKINFSHDGQLLDGQHRLLSCTKSNVAIRTLVTWGLEQKSQLVTDRRGGRSLSDDISIAKFKNSSSVAAVSRVCYYRSIGRSVKQILNHGYANITIPDAMIYEYFLAHPEIVDYQKLISRVYDSIRDLKVSGSILNILVLEFNQICETDASAFWSSLSSGIANYEDDPIILLRKRLSDNARSSVNKLPKDVMAALIIKAWNAWQKGVPVKTLRYTQGGASPESFPEIYNPYAATLEEDDE